MGWRVALNYELVRALLRIVALHLATSLFLLATGLVWWPLGLSALLPVLGLWRWYRAVRAAHDEVDPRLWLRRAQHPRLFELIDEATAMLGMPPLHEVEAVPTVNAFATRRHDKDVVGLGMPLLVTCLRWELLGVVAHECGHVWSEDARHPQRRAWLALAVLADNEQLASAVARAALQHHAADLELFAHAREHRADGWAALVAGRGSVEGMLRTLGGMDHLWSKLLGDLEVLARNGFLVDNAFAILRRAWEAPAARATLTLAGRELEREGPSVTHPALTTRAAHVDDSLDRVRQRPPRHDDCARTLLADADALERDWTRFLPGALFDVPAERLRVIDDASATRQANLLRGKHARAAIAERAGPVAAELPLHALVVLVYDAATRATPREWLVPVKVGRVERVVKLTPCSWSVDEAWALIADLLYEAVERGVLEGEAPLAVRGVLELDGKEWIIGELARAIVEKRGPAEALVGALRAGEEHPRRARASPARTPRQPAPRTRSNTSTNQRSGSNQRVTTSSPHPPASSSISDGVNLCEYSMAMGSQAANSNAAPVDEQRTL